MPCWVLLQHLRKLVSLGARSLKKVVEFANVNSGSGDDYCGANCDSNYGEWKGTSIQGSLQSALKDGKTDEEAGGQYYMDVKSNLFWTWDTPELITRKFKEIVDAEKLGGVMAWSLGEDTYKWEHLKAMQAGVAERGGNTEARDDPEC